MTITSESALKAIRETPDLALFMFDALVTGRAVLRRPEKVHIPQRRRMPTELEAQQLIDYLDREGNSDSIIFWVMQKRGLKPGEIVGNHRNGSNLPGFQVGRVEEWGVLYKRAKGGEAKCLLPSDIVAKLRRTIGDRRLTGDELNDRIFLVGYEDPVGLLAHRMKIYAKDAGIEDWKSITPHGFRRLYGYLAAMRTDRNAAKTAQLLHLKNVASVSTYIPPMSPEEEKTIHSAPEFSSRPTVARNQQAVLQTP